MQTGFAEFEIDDMQDGKTYTSGDYMWRIRMMDYCADIPIGARLTSVQTDVSFADAGWEHWTSGGKGTLSFGSYASIDLPDVAPNVTLDFSYATTKSLSDTILNVTKDWQNLPVSFSVSPGNGNLYIRKKPASSRVKMSITVDYVYEEPTTGHDLYWYDGTKWQECDVFTYDGTQWRPCEVYQYDGTKWQSCAT